MIIQSNVPDPKPEWIRPADMRKYFGLSRSWAYDLINEGKIESKLLRKRGRLTGIRLISYDSVKAYIESIPSSMPGKESADEQ